MTTTVKACFLFPYLSHLELSISSMYIVVITSFVVISNAGIKRFDCIYLLYGTPSKSKFSIVFVV